MRDDLVRWNLRCGATVAPLTVAGLRDIYEVREVPGRTREIVAEHAAVAAALESGDAAAAEAAARHVRHARARLMHMLDRASVDHGG